jgi:hypothetical protein
MKIPFKLIVKTPSHTGFYSPWPLWPQGHGSILRPEIVIGHGFIHDRKILADVAIAHGTWISILWNLGRDPNPTSSALISPT